MSEQRPTMRERQAQLTRDEILRAARRLFAQRGYARTSVRNVADEAGVSAQTVYDSIGSKQALVARLNDLIDAEAGIGAIVEGATKSADPQRIAAMSAAVTRAILEHCADIVHALVTGAAVEPALDTALGEGHQRHVRGADSAVDLLQALGALNTSLDRREAADTLAALTDFRLGLMLRDSYGWSLDRIETWMARTSQTLLLSADG